ncbi:phosphocholine cytidylyltransferase family protein [Nitrosomonas sp. HPC101]|uniref:phosphocholine cytidylyltransferase family protein n=1 Tax=Nitrosomonas sp. HPC101 TaxID=1658667 RepID=UPI00136B45D8|nr:phosphocholine cytidylyltransferase family protein [Nitrosomonas sp. HPC101]MXS85116.1 phosphocholine cytidylyltransferase family protein [Nitrosomonas sp. HPC101]
MTDQIDDFPAKAIILSAGQGRRLLPLTEDTPKCLLPVSGKPVIAWQIDTLLANNIREIVIVAGFQIGKVAALIAERYPDRPDIRVVFNPFYEVADNLASCWIVREEMNAGFLLLNGDTLLGDNLLPGMLHAPVAPITLCIDFKGTFDDDDMKVQLGPQGQVKQVSKKLPAEETDAESIGLIRFSKQGARLFRDAVEQALREPEKLGSWYLAIISALAKQNVVSSHSVSGNRWCEIDFIQDLQKAESYFSCKEADAADQSRSDQLLHLPG